MIVTGIVTKVEGPIGSWTGEHWGEGEYYEGWFIRLDVDGRMAGGYIPDHLPHPAEGETYTVDVQEAPAPPNKPHNQPTEETS